MGKRVLVTGCGPIGALAVAVARLPARPRSSPPTSSRAARSPRRLGATHDRVAATPDAVAPYAADKGAFDILFEASGNGAAFATRSTQCVRAGRRPTGPRRRHDAAQNLIVAKELQLRGTFRFDAEFALAVELMDKGWST